MLLPSTRTWEPWICVWTLGPPAVMNFVISLVFSSEIPVTSVIAWRTWPLAAGWISPADSAFSGMAADRLLLQHLEGGLQPVLGGGGEPRSFLSCAERGLGGLEVEPLRDLAARLVDRVADLLHVDLGHDVERELVFRHAR